MVGRQPHQPDSQQRSEKGADRVQRLTQTEARAAQMGGANIGNERVSRRTTDAFADTIDEPGRDQPADRGRKRKDRLREGGKSIAEGSEKLALAEPVAQRAGKDLCDRSGSFGDAFDDAYSKSRGAKHRYEIDGQQRMDHLG